MALVTELRRTKRGRVSVYLDGAFAFVLHPDVWALSDLRAGEEADAGVLAELRERSLARLAREKALALLGRQPYTARRLYEKLLRHVEDEDHAAAAVARMMELGLVDDADYARRCARDCLNLKGYSAARTLAALRERGVERELAEAVLAELDYDPEPAIAALIRKKYADRLEDEAGLRKTIAALGRRGFHYGDIRRVLDNLAEDADYYEESE